MKAFTKDIIRTIQKEKKRLVALLIIAALGVTMMTGLKAACDDLRSSADQFFDAQNLHDLTVLSTLGLTDDDVTALESLDSIAQAEGVYSETVQIEQKNGYSSAVVKTFHADGIDVPYVVEGRLPEDATEIAVTSGYLADTGKSIGDQVTIVEDVDDADVGSEDADSEDADNVDTDSENADVDNVDADDADADDADTTNDLDSLDELEEAETPNFPNTTFTIVGVVIDVTSVVNPDGATSFRSNGSDDYICFVTPEAVESDYYTAVNMTIPGAKEMDSFSDDYEALVASAKSDIEQEIKTRRQNARYEEVLGEASEKIADAKEKVEDALSDAEAELTDARQELDDGWTEVSDGEAELEEQSAEAMRQIEDGRQQIADGRAEAEDGRTQLDEAEEQLKQQQEELDENEQALLEQMEILEAGEAELAAQKEALSVVETGNKENVENVENTENAENIENTENAENTEDVENIENTENAEDIENINASALEELNAKETELEASRKMLEENLAKITAGKEKLAQAGQELETKRAEIEQAEAQLDAAEAELEENEALAYQEIAEARQTLADARIELEDGEQEYADGLAEYQEKKADAESKIAEAEGKLDDIAACDWYIRDRNALDGFADISSDADCIESIGTLFPIMFLLVAILISLTTITRMVEENRGLIGTYQALGFTDREIYQKFIVYSSVACISGGVLGNIAGYIILPEIIIVIFRTMYLLPTYILGYNYLYGIGGIALFYIAIVGTTLISCFSTVRQMPAALMRPKAPRSGSRILLEYIKPIWRRMSFLNKVTARNLFRYKKRLLMTVFGIAGCTALLLCGFSIKDTVADLLPRQYEQIISYDVLATTAGDDDFDTMESYLSEKASQIETMLPVQITSVDVKNSEGKTLSVQLYVIPEDADLSAFFTLKNVDGTPVEITEDGFYITQNISTILGVSEKEQLLLQDMMLREVNGSVNCLLENYLGNSIFVTEDYYEKVFDTYTPNAEIICLKDAVDKTAFADQLTQLDEVLSVVSVQTLKDEFSQAFALMNMVVYVVIVLAGALAFVVLFTLSTTNISERERELATIKVLGFYDNEVHLYVNKETLILTALGIICGLPLGVLLGNLLGAALKMPAIVYSTTIHKISYLLAAAVAFIFALLVDIITDRFVDRVDPIEALKSVE
jgi:putative ABC transport system permease protein